MIITKEHLSQQIAELDEAQLKEVANFIAFILFIPKGEGGLLQDSVALCHQTRVLDNSKKTWGIGATNTYHIGRQNAVHNAILNSGLTPALL